MIDRLSNLVLCLIHKMIISNNLIPWIYIILYLFNTLLSNTSFKKVFRSLARVRISIILRLRLSAIYQNFGSNVGIRKCILERKSSYRVWMKQISGINEYVQSVQSFSHVRLCDPWTAACQASLSFTNSWSLLKLISIESVMPSNHVILCHPFLLLPSIFPSIKVFSMSQLFASGGQSIAAFVSTSVLSINIQDWFPLGWTGWISLQV